jgi:HprK-related kinase B
MQFVVGRDEALAVGPCLQNLNQVVNFLNSRYMTSVLSQGYELCHAAGVCLGERGLGLAGVSGAGKSTLALSLLAMGARFVSNDRLLVKSQDGSVEMRGVPKMPRVNPGTILAQSSLHELLPPERREALRRLPREQLWELEEKYDVDVWEYYGEDRVQLSVPLSAFVVLTWNHLTDEATRLRCGRLAERPDLLTAIVKHPGPFHVPASEQAPSDAPPAIEPLLRQLGETPYLECTGGVDFDLAAEACWDMLRPPAGRG